MRGGGGGFHCLIGTFRKSTEGSFCIPSNVLLNSKMHKLKYNLRFNNVTKLSSRGLCIEVPFT